MRRKKQMIKIENVEICGLEPAIRGMRNPMNSWEKSDSGIGCPTGTCEECEIKPEYCEYFIQYGAGYAAGPNDLELMRKLAKGGSVHAKYRRMITVYLDITAPLYWWKEFDTYKVGTVANSCSTMHKIHEKKFTFDDFSYEHLLGPEDVYLGDMVYTEAIKYIINVLNIAREKYLKTKDKRYWWQMIQLLPSSYNQKRTVMLNYEVLTGIYKHRKDHKLDEWRGFCKWIETLPYSELITGTVYHVTKLSAADSKDIVLSDGKVSIEEAAEAFKDDPIVKAVTDEANISKSKPKLITNMTVAEFFEDFENQRHVATLEDYLYNKIEEAANAKEEDNEND
jgi:hypothetical protein